MTTRTNAILKFGREPLAICQQKFDVNHGTIEARDRTLCSAKSTVADFTSKINLPDAPRRNEYISFDTTRLLHPLTQNMPSKAGHAKLTKDWMQVCDWSRSDMPNCTVLAFSTQVC